MAFTSINRQFVLDSFVAYLATLPPPAWHPAGSTYHNTYIPDIDQWRGQASMTSMQTTYVAKGWTTGPHVYIALGAPNAAHDGVWVMTPPSESGTHASDCNHDHFGIELVGNFQSTPPSVAQQTLLIETIAALHRWAGLGASLNAHRDCMPGRTCPGDAFYSLKDGLTRRLTQVLAVDPWPARWGPIATPMGDQWGWASVVAWKANWQRLGQCRSHLLYDTPHGAAVQLFDGGDVRLFNNVAEVCYR